MAARRAVSAEEIQDAVRKIIAASEDKDCRGVRPEKPQRAFDDQRAFYNGANWNIETFNGDEATIRACKPLLLLAMRKVQGELDLI